MDVSGLNPTCKDGKYFRANIWSWPVIHHLITIANKLRGGRLVGARTLMQMRHNDGAGLTGQRECNKLADVLEVLVQDDVNLKQLGFALWPEGKDVAIGYPVGKDDTAVSHNGAFVSVKDVRAGKVPGVMVEDIHSTCNTSREHVFEFCRFLRACGGFQVY